MLNAGFRFICCHPDEDDDEYGNVNWRKNLLEKLPLEDMELLRGRQPATAAPKAPQDASFEHHAGDREMISKHKRFKSLGSHTVELSIANHVRLVRREEVIRYLNRAKQQDPSILDLILSL